MQPVHSNDESVESSDILMVDRDHLRYLEARTRFGLYVTPCMGRERETDVKIE